MKKAWIALLTALLMILPAAAWAEAEEDNWYAERADLLRDGLYEMISYEGFAEYFTSSEEVISLIDGWKQSMEKEPVSVSGYDMPDISLLMSMLGEDALDFPPVLMTRLGRSLTSTLITSVNSAYGSMFIAAASIPVLSEGYVMPEGFKPCLLLYNYEDICLCVSFVQIGEGVVSAAAQFCAPELVGMLSEMNELVG